MGCSFRRVLAGLVAAFVLAALPAPARASCFDTGTCPPIKGPFTRADGALVAGSLGLVGAIMGALPFPSMGGAKWSNVNSQSRGVQIYWYSTGGVALGLGVLAVALQASVGDPCPPGST